MAYLLSFLALRTNRSIWRFASVEDLWQVIKAPALGGSLATLALFLVGWTGYPRSVLLLTVLLTVLFMGGMRLAVRSTAKRKRAVPANGNGRKVVIVGAGDTGESVAREIRSNPGLGCNLVGFVDDDPNKQGATIHSLPVLGTIEGLPDLALAHAIQEAFIAIPGATGTEMRRISEACAKAGLNFRTLPSLTQLMQGDGKVRYLRELKPANLLRRDTTNFNEVRILDFLRGKRVMVTGAGGFVGGELCRQVLRFGAESLIMVERVENALHDISLEIRGRYPKVRVTTTLADIKHIGRMSEIFHRFRPQVVFHTAAYKHVPMLEDQPGEAVLNNVVATKRLAEVARKFGTEDLVVLSSHKAVNADNLMGATKKICEMYITALNRASRQSEAQTGGEKTRFHVVRFGNVLGSPGSVVPVFQKQIENGHPITITDPEASRLFMTVSEAVGLVLESACTPTEGDVFVLNMGEPVKIGELAEDLALSLGLSPSEVTRKSVGLRPGDKIQEPLWEDGEEVLPTDNERILAIRQRPKSMPEVEAAVGELEALAIKGDVVELLEKIHEIVPTYRPSRKSPQVAVSRAGEKYRVIVVDDDEALGEMLKDALSGTFNVTTVHSAREGFNHIYSEAPHLILLDVKLPDGSGLDMCRRLREDAEHHRIPIIMITGYGDKDSVVMGLRAGADDYVSKPFSLEELQARIDAVLRRSETIAMVPPGK
jgi:FlaA1/EpsC-like NDP-sugar epimerase/CheY-like chemotaxis protein